MTYIRSRNRRWWTCRDREDPETGGGQGNWTLFQDVAALNKTLGENVKTVRLFRAIDKIDPELAGRCWLVAKDIVFAEKQYNLANKYIEDPLRQYELIKTRYDDQVRDSARRRLADHDSNSGWKTTSSMSVVN